MKTSILALAATMLAAPALASTVPMHAPSVGMQGLKEGNRATMALNALESQGYANFTNFHEQGQNFAADVTRNGQMMHVIVTPQTGAISVQS